MGDTNMMEIYDRVAEEVVVLGPDTDKIETLSGAVFDPNRFSPLVHFTLADAAQGIATINRYNGQTLFPYSVAQHLVLGARYISEHHDNVTALLFLLHDIGEYITHDLVRPWKRQECLRAYNELAEFIQQRIEEYILGPVKITDQMRLTVAMADLRICLDEKAQLRENEVIWDLGCDPLDVVIEDWDWRRAKYEWLAEFERLTNLVGCSLA